MLSYKTAERYQQLKKHHMDGITERIVMAGILHSYKQPWKPVFQREINNTIGKKRKVYQDLIKLDDKLFDLLLNNLIN